MKNKHEDLLLLKKQAFFESGVTPSDLDDQNYFELLEMMSAREPDKRPQDAKSMTQGLG